MLAETERLYLTVTTGLVNVRKTGDGVVDRFKTERELNKQKEEDKDERKMFKRGTKATETQLMLWLSSGGLLGGGMTED